MIATLARRSRRSRFELRDFALAGAGAVLALTSVRNTALCMAVMVPPWMAMAADLARSIEARRIARSPAARTRPKVPVMGIALIAAAVAAVGVVGARVDNTATPQGVAAAYPSCATSVLAGSPTVQRVFTAYGTGGYVIDKLWPQGVGVRVRGIDLSRHRGLRRLRAHRRRRHDEPDGAAVAHGQRHDRGAVLARVRSPPSSTTPRGGRWSPTITGCCCTCAVTRAGRRPDACPPAPGD